MRQDLYSNIINELDSIARDYDRYEYGLPVLNEEEMKKMHEAIHRLIVEADGKAEGK